MSSITAWINERPLSTVTGYRLAVVLHSGGAAYARCQVLSEGFLNAAVSDSELGRCLPPKVFNDDKEEPLPAERAGPCLLKITSAEGGALTLTNFELEKLSDLNSSGSTDFVLFHFNALTNWSIKATVKGHGSLKKLSGGKLRLGDKAPCKAVYNFVSPGRMLSWSCHREAASDPLQFIIDNRGQNKWEFPLTFLWNEGHSFTPSTKTPEWLLFEEIAGRYATLPYWKERDLVAIAKEADLNDRLTQCNLDDAIDRNECLKSPFAVDASIRERVYAMYDQDISMIAGKTAPEPSSDKLL